jgi:hypothetical protein
MRQVAMSDPGRRGMPNVAVPECPLRAAADHTGFQILFSWPIWHCALPCRAPYLALGGPFVEDAERHEHHDEEQDAEQYTSRHIDGPVIAEI